MVGGKLIPLDSAERPLFKTGKHAGFIVEPHSRRELVFEPFDAFALKACKGKAIAFFTDAIGNRYDIEFITPPQTI